MPDMPVPGQQYTVQVGDTLSSIAARAYGIGSLWPTIKQANQSSLKSSDPDAIFPGEIINIPLLPEIEAFKAEQVKNRFTNKAKDELTILIAGREIKSQAARIIRTIHTATDSWTATLEWEPGKDKELDVLLIPFTYPRASVYIGNNLIINGFLYTPSPKLDNSGSAMSLEGFSATADAVDSTLKPPYERNNITLEQLAAELVQPLGIKAVFDFDSGGPFDRITARPEDTIFSHLVKLAGQRGLLISSTPGGDLLFTRAAAGGPVGTIQESQRLGLSWNAKFDGRKRFNAYRGIGQSPGSNSKVFVSLDPKVPRSRFMTFVANNTTQGNIQKAADWKRSKQIAEALSNSLPVAGWIAPNGEVWKENTLVTVISPTLFIPQGFTFLIEQVEFSFDASGKTAILQLVPPQTYTGEALSDPWEIQ